MKKPSKAAVITAAAVVIGFLVGFGIGQRTRAAAPSNVSTVVKDGKVIITADVQNAVQTGLKNYLTGKTS